MIDNRDHECNHQWLALTSVVDCCGLCNAQRRLVQSPPADDELAFLREVEQSVQRIHERTYGQYLPETVALKDTINQRIIHLLKTTTSDDDKEQRV